MYVEQDISIYSTSAGNLFKFCRRASTEYQVAVSDYNLFFISIVEEDTLKGVTLKNIHIMTDKYKCSQVQAIIQSFDKVARHTCTVVFCKLMLWSSMEG